MCFLFYFTEVLLVPQHGSGEVVEAPRVQNNSAVAEGRSNRYGDDLANADHVKRKCFPTAARYQRGASLASGRPVN